ncbi:MAG: protease Do [Deltaproteobacteria bacterium]|nr:protease Do [Deltaproteobacteria bacterium]
MKPVLLVSLLACFLSACEKQEAKAPTPSYADVVERAGPAVVTIRAAKRARAPQQHPFFNDPRFRDFFGGIFPGAADSPPRVQMGLGSGVIVSPDGTILTNHHVSGNSGRAHQPPLI